MVVQGSYDFMSDVVTLRLTHLAKSEAFRQEVLGRLNADEDPFGDEMKNVDVGGVGVGIVDDEQDDFATKLDSILGPGAGDEYKNEMNALTGVGLQDNSFNRNHIWGYWQDQAAQNSALRPKKRQFDLNYLSLGPVVYVGEYSLPVGGPPDIETIEDPDGNRVVMFRNDPETKFKLTNGG